MMLIVIDSRRGLSEEDAMMIEFADFYGLACAIVLSKTDKISRSKAIQEKRKIETKTGLEVFLFSNLDTVYTESIREFIQQITQG